MRGSCLFVMCTFTPSIFMSRWPSTTCFTVDWIAFCVMAMLPPSRAISSCEFFPGVEMALTSTTSRPNAVMPSRTASTTKNQGMPMSHAMAGNSGSHANHRAARTPTPSTVAMTKTIMQKRLNFPIDAAFLCLVRTAGRALSDGVEPL